MKTVRKILAVLWYTILAVVVILLSAGLAIQIPTVQTYIVTRLTDKVMQKNFNADITFDKIHFTPFNTLVINNISIVDKAPCTIDTTICSPKILPKIRDIGHEPIDTFFTAKTIVAKFSLQGLLGGTVNLNGISVMDGRMNLVIEDGNYKTNLNRMFNLLPGRNKDVPYKEVLHIRDVRVDGFRFTMKNYTSRHTHVFTKGIDWYDLDVQDIVARGRHLRVVGKIVSGELDFASFREKSGYICTSVSGSTIAGRGRTKIENIKLKDPWSDISVKSYVMLYNSPKDFRGYVEKVRMEGDIEKSSLSYETLKYFVKALPDKDLDLKAIIEGKVFGTVRNFTVDTLVLAMPERNIQGGISGNIQGLTSKKGINLDARIDSLRFTLGEIGGILADISPKMSGKNFPQLAPNEEFCMNAEMQGSLDSLKADVEIESSAGSLGTSIAKQASKVNGTLWAKNLDIKNLAGKTPIGPVSMKASFNADLGTKTTLGIDYMQIDRLNFNGYDYSGITGSGSLNDKLLKCSLDADDPSLDAVMNVIAQFPKDTIPGTYRLNAEIRHADLHAMNIDKRGPSEIVLDLDTELSQKGKNISGEININNIVLTNDSGQYDIGDIEIMSKSRKGRHQLRLTSDFIKGIYSGGESILTFFPYLKEITLKRELPALFHDETDNAQEDVPADENGPKYRLNLRTLNTSGLLSFISPGLFASEGTLLNIEVLPDRTLRGSLKSDRIAFKENFIKGLNVNFDNLGESLNVEALSSEICLATVSVNNNRFEISADDNHVSTGFSYKDHGDLINEGEIMASADILRDSTGTVLYDVRVLPSSLYIDSMQWDIYPSHANIYGKEIDITSFEVMSGVQSISAAGKLTQNPQDTLSVNLDKFNLSILDQFIGKKLELNGEATGSADITSTSTGRAFLLDLICDSTSIGGTFLGDLDISSSWNNDIKGFNIAAGNSIKGKRTFDISGIYSPSMNQIDMAAILDSVDIGFTKPFIESIFSDISGHISGHVSVNGDTRNISIDSRDAYMENAFLKVAYTNVGYKVNGPFHLDEDGIYFDSANIEDQYDGSGKLTGKIGYDHFRDIILDLGMNVNNIEVLDLDENAGGSFYGNLFASGNLDITGPLDDITLSADAITSKEGNLHIPIASSMNAGESELLKFKQDNVKTEVDPYEQMISDLRGRRSSGKSFSMHLKVTATPDVNAFVELDKSGDNAINAHGNGVLNLEINPANKIFDIKGDYTINAGNLHFVALGIAGRDFVINEGSIIRFTGDLKDSDLEIDATYKTKASIATLISDTTTIYSNRRPVDCGIKITGKLSNPRLNFSINIPDLDPAAKARVDNALSSDDKVQKQFLYLLISGNFLPEDQSGIVNNSNALLTNVSDILLRQLNNILQKLNIPIDLGLNYQQNTRGNNVFDVALSTQLFNNRVVINGNIGNRQYNNGSSQSDIVGDIDIEVKLNRSGALRLNLFSHSADQYTNYLDNSQRNGVGFTFGQEFNKFKDLRRLFMRKKRREQEAMKDIERAQNEEKKNISITAGDVNSRKKKRK